MNGVIYLILNVGGIFKLINEISPKVAVGPTIAIFGFMLSEECTRVLPQRHHWIICKPLRAPPDAFTSARLRRCASAACRSLHPLLRLL